MAAGPTAHMARPSSQTSAAPAMVITPAPAARYPTGATHRPSRVDQQERGCAQGRLRGAVLREERLPLNGIGTGLESTDERVEELGLRYRVRVDDDDCVRGRRSCEDAVDRPLQRTPL